MQIREDLIKMRFRIGDEQVVDVCGSRSADYGLPQSWQPAKARRWSCIRYRYVALTDPAACHITIAFRYRSRRQCLTQMSQPGYVEKRTIN